MDLLSELRTAVYSDLTAGTESTLFPLATVDLALNRSYRRCGALFRWPETEDAKKTSTEANVEYYNYPDNWRPDSLFRLEVNDEQYGELPDGSPLAFEDYLIWRRDTDNANSTEKKWSNQWRRFFIYPVPTTTGNNNISVWGQKVVDVLVNVGDTTIFSYAMPECNDAVVLEAVAILKAKANQKNDGEFVSVEAKQILISAWAKIKQERQKNEKNQPFFEIPDFFAGRKTQTRPGNFD